MSPTDKSPRISDDETVQQLIEQLVEAGDELPDSVRREILEAGPECDPLGAEFSQHRRFAEVTGPLGRLVVVVVTPAADLVVGAESAEDVVSPIRSARTREDRLRPVPAGGESSGGHPRPPQRRFRHAV